MDEMKRDSETAPAACECYINAAEIKTGRWQEDPWECLRNCRAQFLQTTLERWGLNEGWIAGCESLNRDAPVREFWSLYWCDMTFCGVGIDPVGGLEQDPNVDLIINTCQNIGFHAILDPGPPPLDFTCTTEADTGCSVTAAVQAPHATPPPQTASHPEPTSTNHRATEAASSTQAKPPPAAVAPQPTEASPVDTHSPSPTAASTTSGSSLTGQGKAAIAICSVLALLLLVCFALVWLRRRKRRKASFHRALRARRGLPSADAGPAGSPTPLISPVSSAMGTRPILAPPLRLRDRKFLPSLLRRTSRSPSPPLTPLTPAYSPQPGGSGGNSGSGAVFPSSPLCSPTVSRLTPRHERATTAAAIPRSLTDHHTLSRQQQQQQQPQQHQLHTPPPFSPPPSSFLLLPHETTLPDPSAAAASTPWPAGPPGPNTARDHRGSASASSCYTAAGPGTGGTSTAHSSLRQEIPIAIPLFAGAGVVGGGGGAGSGSGIGSGREQQLYTPPPPPPPPPLARHGSASPSPAPSASPCRPPRPHEGMLEIPGLVSPAFVVPPVSSSGGGAVAGERAAWDFGEGARGSPRRVGSGVGTPPPPPLSPPPTRALPRTPPAVAPSPPPHRPSSSASSVPKDSAWREQHGGLGAVPLPSPRAPPPSLASARTAGTGVTGRSPAPSTPPPPYARLSERGSPVPEVAAGSGKGQVHFRDAEPSGPFGYAFGFPEHDGVRSGEAFGMGKRPDQDARGSWGSWSGTGTVTGGGHYHTGALSSEKSAAAAGRLGDGDAKRDMVSPRTSEGSDVTATRETVSRMSSMRDGPPGGRI